MNERLFADLSDLQTQVSVDDWRNGSYIDVLQRYTKQLQQLCQLWKILHKQDIKIQEKMQKKQSELEEMVKNKENEFNEYKIKNDEELRIRDNKIKDQEEEIKEKHKEIQNLEKIRARESKIDQYHKMQAHKKILEDYQDQRQMLEQKNGDTQKMHDKITYLKTENQVIFLAAKEKDCQNKVLKNENKDLKQMIEQKCGEIQKFQEEFAKRDRLRQDQIYHSEQLLSALHQVIYKMHNKSQHDSRLIAHLADETSLLSRQNSMLKSEMKACFEMEEKNKRNKQMAFQKMSKVLQDTQDIKAVIIAKREQTE